MGEKSVAICDSRMGTRVGFRGQMVFQLRLDGNGFIRVHIGQGGPCQEDTAAKVLGNRLGTPSGWRMGREAGSWRWGADEALRFHCFRSLWTGQEMLGFQFSRLGKAAGDNRPRCRPGMRGCLSAARHTLTPSHAVSSSPKGGSIAQKTPPHSHQCLLSLPGSKAASCCFGVAAVSTNSYSDLPDGRRRRPIGRGNVRGF